MSKFLISVFLTSLICITTQAQELRFPYPSPPQVIKQDFGLSSIELSYSRPGVKSRPIFGDLVPFGKVWRTGANDATTINFGDDVMIDGKKVPAGKYGLLTIPGEKDWTIILSKQLDVTNPANYKQEDDILRVNVSAQNLDFSIENLTFLFANLTNSSCDLQLIWDRTLVTLPIHSDVDGKIMAAIDKSMNQDNRPYFQSAMYYMDNGKDLNKALVWFNKATESNPKAYFMFYQKARCLAKMGNKKDAVATAQKGIELAKEANNNDYVTLNEKLIASLK